ncbi:rod shape-determining protein MreC [Polaribacter sp. IC073]|uniref:rod shape-determining protein MreC n=1 Tax=Polaribacter sp. IC073 TaxID=2508540 RepID=UPI0011BFDF37|nr:rod shape-determining protein MreC [Polaribacter sp. IC073]TXD46837.1 rod shape-determining protein MreC [Polaribacter sp. IC073]
MQQLIYFFQKFKHFLFFLLLQLIALTLTFNNLNFHKSKYVNSANAITGGMYNQVSSISDYFDLKKTNTALLEDNTRLRNLLQQKTAMSFASDSIVIDTVKYHQKYTFSNAKIINNNYVNAFNFLTIDKGRNDGLEKEMAVVNGKGVIGITDNASSNYTRVQSILNKNSRLNARLKNGYFGTLKWNGLDYNVVQLTDIPRQAPVKIGDTIETGGKSTIFPEGILIGTVIEINNDNAVDNAINVKLFNDMSNIGPVYVIKNLEKKEIQFLENPINE